jgi:4-aminobutyrate aminotransferase
MTTIIDEKSNFTNLLDKIDTLLAPSLAQDWPMLPIVKAEGAYLYTNNGQRLLDFTCGIGVTNVGHSHPRVLDAARIQMEKISHSSVGITIHESLLQLCEALTQVLPSKMEMFFFGNSGTEAVEGAIKLARYVTKRPAIIAFEGGFHGRSYGAASITTVKSKYRLHYEPFVPSIYFAPYAYQFRCPLGDTSEKAIKWSLDGIQKIFDHFVSPSQVAAIIVEPVQGECGYIVPPHGFLQELRRICDDYGILLILDEVQTGFGRTGQMFASQVFGIQPDIMAIAKGIASGFPLSATVASQELMGQWDAVSHGTTFGGNPVACAAALATLDVIREENMLENCKSMGLKFLNGLRNLQSKYPFIGEVRGIGLMLALEMVYPNKDKKPNPNAVMATLNNCLKNGLVAYIAGNQGQVVRLIPPLNVTHEQVEQALHIMDESLHEVSI